jgi:UDP-glucose 4-epimerase
MDPRKDECGPRISTVEKPMLVVGAGSHLASVWRSSLSTDLQVEFLSHEAICRPGVLEDRSVVINFCRHPELDRRLIAVEHLPEVRLARQIANSKCHLIQMSSRRVYAPSQSAGALSELSELDPTTMNGANKLAGERAIVEILDERLTILRLANVFGLELQSGRRTFMARLLAGLKNDRRVVFDVSLSTARDFFPDRSFARILQRIVSNPMPGVFNLGSGIATPIGDIAAWTISGFGDGAIACTSDEERDAFVLDVGRIVSRYGPTCTIDEIDEYCHLVGAMARNLSTA